MMSSSIFLNGLDGSNPLAFLAALGTLRTLSLALPDETVKMSWERLEGAWRPQISSSCISSSHILDIVVQYFSQFSSSSHPVMVWDAWTSKDAASVRASFGDAAGNNSRRVSFTSAIGSDAAPPSKEEGPLDNPLRAARTDYFIKNLAAIISRCDRSHLDAALFCHWDYGDAMENQSLRLDPSEDRRHAYQWSAPTTDKSRRMRGTMLGANRLAIEAYDYFQSCMGNRTLATVAFGTNKKRKRRLRWPIWIYPCSDNVTQSVLRLQAIWGDFRSHREIKELRSMGVATVNESLRITVGDSNPRINFSPSRALF